MKRIVTPLGLFLLFLLSSSSLLAQTYTATWLDNSGDGNIDQVQIDFSENISITDNTPGDAFDAFSFTGGVTVDNVVGFLATDDFGTVSGVNQLVLNVSGVTGTAIPVSTITYTQASDEQIIGDISAVEIADAAVPTAIVDGANPVIISAVTGDVGGVAGEIDQITVTFSEDIEADDVDADDTGNTAGQTDDFIVAGYAISGVATQAGGSTDDDVVIISLTESGGNDTGATPNLTLNASELNDLVTPTPNEATAFSGAVTDGVAPVLLSTVTNDNDGNGQIDQIIVTYSETMEADDIDADDTGNATGDTDDFIVTGYDIASVATQAGGSTDDDVIVITLVESGGPDTDATPTLTIAVGELNDLAMNGNAASSAAVVDGANPVIISAVTGDVGGVAGEIDQITVTFSEDIEADDVDADDTGNTAGQTDDFIVAGYAISGVATQAGGSTDDDVVIISLTESGGNDTGATPNLTLNASELNDLVTPTPNEATAFSGAVTDGVAPVLLSTVTNDNDGNGQIDQIIVTYSETMEADDIDADDTGNATGDTDDFIVTGYDIASVATQAGGSTDDDVIVITLVESGGPDTDATPTLTIAVGELNDLAMNGNAASSAAVVDGANPVIISAVTGDVGGVAGEIDQITVTFSEDIEADDVDADDTGNTAGQTDDFIVAGYAISGVATQAGGSTDDDVVIISLTESGGNDTGATPNLTLNASELNDLVTPTPNEATAFSGAVTDGVAPVLLSTVTNDNDGNGQIDQIIVTYSETMEADDIDADDTGNATGDTDDFIVTGYDIASVATQAGGSTDDDVIVITLVESGGPDTDATPTLTIAVGELNDLAMNGNAASSAAVVDGANPVIISAVTGDVGGVAGEIDQITVTFSEDIEADDVDADDTGNTAGQTDDFIVAGYAISGVATQAGGSTDDDVVIISLTESGGNDTGATPNLTLNASELNDLVTPTPNEATAFSGAVTDGVAPVLLSTVTNDNDGNGQIDQIIVTYSETMEADDIDADDTGNATGDTDDFIVTGYDIASVATQAGGSTDDDVIVITLVESGGPDTDATPTLTIAVGELNDLAMNGNAASSAAVVDGANPVIISAVTGDVGGVAGEIDQITVTFSEDIEADDVDADDTGNTAGQTDDFIVAGYVISGVATQAGGSTDDDVVIISLTESGGNDTGATPNLTLNASELNDLVTPTPNEATAFSGAVTDGVAPVLLSTVTNDNDGNGQIDQIIVTYSETMEADDIDADDTGNATGDTDDFIVTGYDIASVATQAGGSTDDDVIVITLVESGGPDTDATPTLTIAVGELNDLAMNGNAASSAAVVDGANPVIISAVTGDVGGVAGEIDQITVTFSEDIEADDVDADDTGNTAGQTDDFIVAGYAISGVATQAGGSTDDDVVIISLTESGGNDTGATPNLTLNASELNDLVTPTPNEATAFSGAVTDGVAPVLLSTVTNDNDGNGQIDQIIVTYSETMEADDIDADDTGNTTGDTDDFIVTGYDIASVATQAGGSTDDDVIVITLVESGGPDTDATPTLTIAVGELNDLAMNGNAASSAAVTDEAIPVIVSAVTDDTGGIAGEIDQITVTFSEDIDPLTLDTGGPGSDDFIVTDGAYTYTITSVAAGVGADEAVITLTEDRGIPDTGITPDINLGINDIEDQAAANNTLGVAQDFTATQDGAAPVLYDFELQPTNSFIQVVYSEPLVRQAGGGAPTLADFNENQANVTAPTTISINDITDALGDPVTGAEDTIQFTLTVAPVPSTYDAGDNVVIDTDGSTLEDAAGNDLDGAESTGNVQVNDVNNVVTIVGATWVTTSAAPNFEGYVELEFSDGVYGENTGQSIRLAHSVNGIYEQGDWTDGDSDCAGDDQLCGTYDANGSTVFVNTDSNNDVELRAGANGTGGAAVENDEIRFETSDANNVINYDGTLHRFQLNDIDNGPWTGSETYTFGPSGAQSGKINGRSSAATMVGSYTFVFTMPDFVAEDFDAATATARDDDGDGNIDQVEVVMPDGVEDATITPSDFEFNSVPAVGYLTGVTADDNTFILLFDDYTGTAVVGNLVYTAGTLEDDAQVNASYLPSGNAVDGGTITPVDAAGPVILSAVTGDTDLNGEIDELVITFSEVFDDLGIAATSFTPELPFTRDGTITVNAASALVTLGITEVGVNTDDIFDISVVADILEDQSAPDGANNIAQTFTNTEDGVAAYATVDVLATANQNPQITGQIDDLDAQILVSVGGGTKTATNNADGTWTLPAGSLDSNLPIGFTYDVVLTTIDASNTPPNIGADDSSNELTINGGVTVSPAALETLCNGDDYITLGDITLTETDNGGFSNSGNIILSLPAGFEFNTAVLPSFTGAGYDDITIDLETSTDPEETEFIGSASFSIEIDNDGSADELDVIIINGLQVRAVGSVARLSDDITRTGGTATVSAPPSASYGQLASNAQPSDIANLDVTTPEGSTADQTELVIRNGLTFSIDATDQQDGTVEWDENVFDGVPGDFTGLVATQAALNSADGLYTYFVYNDDATCLSNPLEFELLLFSDDDPTTPAVDSTFIDRSYIVTDETDTIYLSNPAGHTVNVSGAGTTVTNPGDSPNPLLVIFDPAIAGDDGAGGSQTHTITYSITNNTTLASRSESVTYTVEPETEIFTGSPVSDYCSDFGGGRLDLQTDIAGFNSPSGLPSPTAPYINNMFVLGLISGFNGDVSGPALEAGAVGGGVPWQYSLDITGLGIAAGEFEVVRFSREIVETIGGGPSLRKRTDAVNYFTFFGVPDVRFSNLTFGDFFCSDDSEFTINRNIRYVSSIDDSNPDEPVATYFEESDVSITNGYILYINDGVSNDAPAYGFGWRLIDDFTHDDGGVIDNRDRFFPGNPDQDGNTVENEEGRYLIEYTTEDSGPNNCTSTIYTEIDVFNQPAVPTLDAATMAIGSTVGFVVNGSPDPGVDGNEYLLEYCVGDDITGQNFVAAEGSGGADNICYYEYNTTTMTYDLLGCSNAGMPYFVVLAVPPGGTNLTADETVEFFMTQQINGCESEYRKVTVTVHPLAPAPTITDVDATLFADDYYLDFCADNGASVSPGSFQMDALGANEEYEYSVTRYNSGGGIVSTDLVRTSSRDIPIVAISDGERHEYNVRKVDNINPDGNSSFTGCVGPGIDVFIFGFEEPTAVTAADFSANTLEYHVGENATPLDDFDHTNLANLYTWYETNAPSGQMGTPVVGGGTFSAGDLTGFDQSSVASPTVDDIYRYYVTRTTNVDADLGFDGCESTDVPTEVSITVHAIQPQPDVLSDTTGILGNMVGDPAFGDLNPGPFQDLTVDHYFSLCTDQLEPDYLFHAFEATNEMTPRVFRWYNSDVSSVRGSLLPTDGTGTATFSEIGISGLNPAVTIQRYFEVIQVTDNDVFEGVESVSTFIRIDISPQDALEFRDDATDLTFGDSFCRDDLVDIDVDLYAGGSSAGAANVEYRVDSYLQSTFDAMGTPEVASGTIAGNPTIDFDALHDAVLGALSVGGESTVHVYTMTYTDPITLCSGIVTKTITIHPDPDVVFTVNGTYIDNVAFIGSDVFCYENGNVDLEAFQYLYDNTGIIDTVKLITGQFVSDQTGAIGLDDGEGIFDPLAQHNAFHTVTGTAGEFLNRSTINVEFTYTDGFSCDRTIDVDLFVDPQPEVLEISGLPTADLAEDNASNNIRVTGICSGSTVVTAEVQFKDPLESDLGSAAEDNNYASYTFNWTVNGLPVVDLNIDGLANTIEFAPATDVLEFEVEVTDTQINNCSRVFNETHVLQELPDLDIDGITDSEQFCVGDANPTLGLLDLAEDGDDATNTANATDIANWRVESYSEGALPAVQIASGSGSLPTVDLDAWHTDPTLTVPGMLVGGTRTFHTIIIEYTDPSREYQGQATGCTNTVSETIIVNPDPDIVFTVNDVFIDNAAFATSNIFCYQNVNFGLEAFQYIYDNTGVIDTVTASGQFTSDQTGIIEDGATADFNPLNQHNAFHGVSGTDGEFLNRSTINVSFSFTNEIDLSTSCSRTIDVDLFVEPDAEVLPLVGLPSSDLASGSANNIRLLDVCSGSGVVTAEIQLIDPLDPDPGSVEEDDYSIYSFVWTINDLPITDLNLDGLDNTIEFVPLSNTLAFDVTVTDVNGCGRLYEETHELQELPILDIVGIVDNQEFCVDVVDPTLELADDARDGDGAANTVNPTDVVSWSVDSYSEGSLPAVQIASGAGSIPTVDLDAWHTDPSLTVPGTLVGGARTFHTITIQYTDPSREYQGVATQCTNTVVETIIVNPSPDISITLNEDDLDDIQFCYDDINIQLVGIDGPSGSSLGSGAFTINGGTVSTNDGRASFNAATYHGGDPFAVQSRHTIEYTYTDANGCDNIFTRDFLVNPRPQFVGNVIQTASTCATESVELFVEMTDGDANYEFTWFVNGTEVDAADDEDLNPNDERITYDFEGQLSVNFGVTARYIGPGFTTNCEATIPTQTITVGAEPIPSLTWVGITANNANGTDFVIAEDNATLPDIDVSQVELEIDGVSRLLLVEDLLTSEEEIDFPISFNYEFLTPGLHTLDLTMNTFAGCDITIRRNVRILPHFDNTQVNPTNSYSQSFEGLEAFDLTSAVGGWLIDSLSLDGKTYYDTATSWTLGLDASGTIPGTVASIDGTGAVVTVRNGANAYEESEVSFVYSPSFDLSGFTAPTVSFLRYEDFETFRDGAVFQVSVDDGRTWETVGSYNALLENVGLASTPGWYNREGISSSPGSTAPGSATATNNAQVGWALQSDWEEAIAPIEIDAADNGFVRFRFALSAQAGEKTTNGFAFDLFRIYERNQVVLLELFSSTLTQASIDVNQTVDTDPQFSGNDILKINYFTDLENNGDSIDVINQRNTSEPGAKVAFYGIGDIPSMAISGDANSLVTSSIDVINAKLANARLNNPAFDITIDASVESGNLVVDADFTATTPFTAFQEVALMIAVVEPVVTLTEDMGRYDAGDNIQNVLRKILPDASGQYESGPILSGGTRSLETVTWPISEMYDPSNVRVIAYVQDINSKVIYQATSVDLPTGLSNSVLGLEDELDFVVYPNPADEEVTIEFAGGIQEDTDWVVFDQAGREVFKGQVDKGTESLTIATDEIPSGLYFIHLNGEDLKQRVKRVMVIH